MLVQGVIGSFGKLSIRPVQSCLNQTLNFSTFLSHHTLEPAKGSNTTSYPILTPQAVVSSASLLSLKGQGSLMTNQLQVRYREYKTKSRRFPGHIDIYGHNDGKRESLKAAEDRFKRLDWGVYVKTIVGKDNKRWKRSPVDLWKREQHIFATKDDNFKFERMFANETKRQRYFPDDYWEKYNNTTWWRHHWTKLKNAENIRQLGNKVHLYDRYLAHMKLGQENKLPTMHYAPPGYLKNIKSNPAGVYTEDPMIPKVEMAPHFQRQQLRPLRHRKDPRLMEIKDLEMYHGYLPIWSTLLHPRTFPN